MASWRRRRGSMGARSGCFERERVATGSTCTVTAFHTSPFVVFSISLEGRKDGGPPSPTSSPSQTHNDITQALYYTRNIYVMTGVIIQSGLANRIPPPQPERRFQRQRQRRRRTDGGLRERSAGDGGGGSGEAGLGGTSFPSFDGSGRHG